MSGETRFFSVLFLYKYGNTPSFGKIE